MYWKIFF